MRVFTYASKDTFITNVAIRNSFRAEDANVGQAGELTLFKLHEESVLPNTSSGVQEISRILIKFDLNPLRFLTSSGQPLSGADLSKATFKLRLFDALHGDTLPANFKIIVFPLSKSFDEGSGMDPFAFQDIGSANFLTASGAGSTAVKWEVTGADHPGVLGSDNLDIISSGTIDGTLTDLFATQTFDSGEEDLSIDVTTVVSATLVGLLPDHGFRIGYSGSEETDNKTRFVKKFFSRHANVYSKQPRLEAIFDDTVFDNKSNFIFDTTGSIFLRNTPHGSYEDIVSGSISLTGSLTDVDGGTIKYNWAVPVVRLESGSFKRVFTGSRHSLGLYSASFSVHSLESELLEEIKNANSATFDVIWHSANHEIAYLTSSLVIKSINRASFIKPKKYMVQISNLKQEYHIDETAQFRVFTKEVNYSVDAKKVPSEIQSSILHKMYYQIRQLDNSDKIMPYDKTNNSTRLSYDEHSNYFNLQMRSFAPGKNYKIEFLIIEDGVEQAIDENIVFRVVK